MSGLKKALLAAVCITAVAGAYLHSRTKKREEDSKAEEEGNEFSDSVNDYRKLKWAKHNIMFGIVGENEEVISISADGQESERNSNVLVVGSTGTGKTYSYQFSNLLAGNTSAVVVDLHGEYELIQDRLEENGLKVFVIDTDKCGSDELVKEMAIKYISRNKGVIFIVGNEKCCYSSDYIAEIFYQLCGETDRTMPVMFYIDDGSREFTVGFNRMFAVARTHKIGFHLLQQSVSPEIKDVSNFFDSVLYLSGGFGKNEDNLKWIAEKAEMDIEKIKSLPADKALLIVRGLKPIILDKLKPENFFCFNFEDEED